MNKIAEEESFLARDKFLLDVNEGFHIKASCIDNDIRKG